jgi:peptidoglycan/LPS O-acetylase OafA/YrhL
MTGASAGAATYGQFQAREYFGALDGLRAVAILLVLFHHVPHLAGGVGWTLQDNGRYGVAVFFTISGFLISTLLLREERRNGRIALGRFYARRAVRLLPLYYVALGLQAALVFGANLYTPENQLLFREKLPGYLLYFSNWLPTATQGPFFCAWSLAVEEQFYLGFGALLLFCRRGLLVAGLAAALLAKFAIYQAWGDIDTASALWRIVFSYQEAILWGVLLGFALDRPAVYRRVAFVVHDGYVLAAVGLAASLWLLLHPMQSQSTWDAELLNLLVTLLLAGVVVRRSPTPGLDHPLLRHIGRVSYGIYLLHMFVLSAVKKIPGGTQPWVCFVATSVITIVVASAVYRWFEQPIIQYFRRRSSPAKSTPFTAAIDQAPATVQG